MFITLKLKHLKIPNQGWRIKDKIYKNRYFEIPNLGQNTKFEQKPLSSQFWLRSTFSVLRRYFEIFTSTFFKSGLLIGREVQAEVHFWTK